MILKVLYIYVPVFVEYKPFIFIGYFINLFYINVHVLIIYQIKYKFHIINNICTIYDFCMFTLLLIIINTTRVNKYFDNKK